jgi:transcription initiation factor TFIIIB Brf1 subunit/transcription initiation factor TFIIB
MDDTFIGVFNSLFKDTACKTTTVSKYTCPSCDSEDIKMQSGNYVCQDCSCIVSKNLDSQAEWRTFEDSPDISRCTNTSVNEFFPSSTMATVMGYCSKKGKSSTSASRREEILARRTNQWNNSSYEERNLQSMISMINSQNNLVSKSILKDAEYICKAFMDKNVIRGDSKENMVATCVYLAFKMNGVPRHKKEIALMFKINEEAFSKSSKKFEEEYSHIFGYCKASDFIMRMASDVNINGFDASKCMDYCKKIQGRVRNSKPNTLAAACILQMFPDVDRIELEKAAFVSKNTFQNLQKTLPDPAEV